MSLAIVWERRVRSKWAWLVNERHWLVSQYEDAAGEKHLLQPYAPACWLIDYGLKNPVKVISYVTRIGDINRPLAERFTCQLCRDIFDQAVRVA